VQAPLDTTVPINAILTAWGLLMGRTPGDGDCGYHVSLRTAQRSLSRGAYLTAHEAAAQLRSRVIAHARAQPSEHQQQAGSSEWDDNVWQRMATSARCDRRIRSDQPVAAMAGMGNYLVTEPSSMPPVRPGGCDKGL
jgi:hypothetical protein